MSTQPEFLILRQSPSYHLICHSISRSICHYIFVAQLFIDFNDNLKVLIFWDVLVIDSILIWEVNSEKSEAFKKQTLECFGLNFIFNCALLFITSGSKVTFECWLGKANDHCRQVSSKRGARNYLELNCLSSRRKVFYIHPKHITPTSLLLLLLLDILKGKLFWTLELENEVGLLNLTTYVASTNKLPPVFINIRLTIRRKFLESIETSVSNKNPMQGIFYPGEDWLESKMCWASPMHFSY